MKPIAWVADSDPSFRTQLALELEQLDMRVRTFASGPEFMAALATLAPATEIPDVAIVESTMTQPDLSGAIAYARGADLTTQWIATRDARLPDAGTERRKHCHELLKPLSSDALQQTLRALFPHRGRVRFPSRSLEKSAPRAVEGD